MLWEPPASLPSPCQWRNRRAEAFHATTWNLTRDHKLWNVCTCHSHNFGLIPQLSARAALFYPDIAWFSFQGNLCSELSCFVILGLSINFKISVAYFAGCTYLHCNLGFGNYRALQWCGCTWSFIHRSMAKLTTYTLWQRTKWNNQALCL